MFLPLACVRRCTLLAWSVPNLVKRVGLLGGEHAQLVPLRGQQHQAAPPLHRAAGGTWQPLPNCNGGRSHRQVQVRDPSCSLFLYSEIQPFSYNPSGPGGSCRNETPRGQLLVPNVRVWTAVCLQHLAFHCEGTILALPVIIPLKLGFHLEGSSVWLLPCWHRR